MDFTGRVIDVLQKRSGTSKTGKPWAMQEYVLENDGRYPERVCFEVFGSDKIDQYNIQLGETLTVSFEFAASQYNGKWYNKVRAWRVRRFEGNSTVAQQPSSAPMAQTQMPNGTGGNAQPSTPTGAWYDNSTGFPPSENLPF